MIRPMLFFILFLFCLQTTYAQIDEHYAHTYKSKKTVVNYSYRLLNDSLFCVGIIMEKNSKSPTINVNIQIQGTQIGTVSNLQGIFKIHLPREKGILVFNKIGEFKFEISFDKQAIIEKERMSH